MSDIFDQQTRQPSNVNLDKFPSSDEKEILKMLLRKKDLHYSPSIHGDKVTLEVIFVKNESESDDEYKARLAARSNLSRILLGCGIEPIRINPNLKYKGQLDDTTKNLAINMKVYDFKDIVELVKLLGLSSVREILDFGSDILADVELKNPEG